MPFASAVVAISLGTGSGAQAPVTSIPVCRDLTVSLKAPQIALAGFQPVFQLTLSNATARPVRVVNIYQGRRSDLQGTYFELVVFRGGAEMSLPRAPSDPGPIGSDDMLTLDPGQGLVVSDLRVLRDLTHLVTGDYEVAVLVWREPMAPSTTRCRSPFVRMQVREAPQSDIGA